MLTFRSTDVVAIGEAMIEMAVVGPDTYRRGFAGDTFNTAWQMAQVCPPGAVRFVTKVGTDAVSDAFVQGQKAEGLDVAGIGRVRDRMMGLYMIELDGAERQFHYWRGQSAARLVADDRDWLRGAIGGAGLIHLSGITLAILSAEARDELYDVLAEARAKGARLSFDPNMRPRLWPSLDAARATLARFFQMTDIALPSFDDEATLWGDATPEATMSRLHGFGIAEIAVKNGAGPVIACSDVGQIQVNTPPVAEICDTSGAGDAFNAGYLAARLRGKGPLEAVRCGQRMSAEVIRHFGARIPLEHMPSLA